MISTESFSKEWIEGVAQQYGYHDKELLEKVIRAFALLETLVDAGAPLTFKGGSSILLLLKDNLNRLSIDEDVICPPDTYILQYLNDLEKHGFLRAIPVRAEHAGKKLPASHSKVFYEVAFSNPNSNDAFIRLDVLYEDNPYTHTIAVPIDLPFLKQEGTDGKRAHEGRHSWRQDNSFRPELHRYPIFQGRQGLLFGHNEAAVRHQPLV